MGRQVCLTMPESEPKKWRVLSIEKQTALCQSAHQPVLLDRDLANNRIRTLM